MRLSGITRLLRILRVCAHYRLDELADAERMPRMLRAFMRLVPKARSPVATQPRGARLRLALQELGPIFVVSSDLARVLAPGADVGLRLADHGVSVVPVS